MALQMGGMNAARVVGPVLAGGIVAITSVKWVYVMAVVLYLLALFAMSRVSKSPPAEGMGKKPVLSELVAGMRYVSGDAPVRALMILSIVPILLAMPFQSLLVVFAEDIWEVGDGGLGILQAAAGVGGIFGSLYVAWAGETDRKLRLMMASLLAFLYPQRVGKVGILAGFVPGGLEELVVRRPLAGKPFMVIHGTRDQMVTIERARASIEVLERASANVTYCEDEVGHKVSVTCLRALKKFFTDTRS